VLGTIFPQTRSAIDAFDLRNAAASSAGEQLFTGLTLLVGTVTTLAYFQFTAKQHGKQGSRRSRIVESMAFLGRIFIAVTFGVFFAGVYASALTALIERLSFIWQFIFSL